MTHDTTDVPSHLGRWILIAVISPFETKRALYTCPMLAKIESPRRELLFIAYT